MKKIICIILMAVMICNPYSSITAEAAIIPYEEVVTNAIEYLDNGDMIVTTITCYTNGMSAMAEFQTKTATKRREYSNSSGVEQDILCLFRLKRLPFRQH